jgi:predicted ATPase
VMDNFEHLLDAAPSVGTILSSAPGITVLVTSRERLHIYGEYEYPVVPLALPDLSRRESQEQVLRYDALRLFFQRAQAVRPGLHMDAVQTAAAVQICTQLDGLPLALELAAIQAKIYTLPQLAEQLNNKLTNLPGGPRDLPARQRTLRATIEWSYSLLSSQEKILFARLAIFRGGATLEAIEDVCQDAQLAHIREHLTSLVDKNMIAPREGRDGELHFTLLETIREYALEHLQSSGELAWLLPKHAAYFAGLAERADAEIRGARQSHWFARLRAERENVRAALDWAFSEADTLDGLRLVAALAYFWYYDGQSIEEARGWANLATERSKNAPPWLAAGVFICAGRIGIASAKGQGGKGKFEEAHRIYQRIGDESRAAWALIYLCSSYFGSEEDARQGIDLCNQGLAYFRKVNDKLGASQALNILGELSRRLGDYEAAKHYYGDCLELSKETGEELRIAMQYSNLSMVAYHQNQPEVMETMAKNSIRLFDQLGSEFGVLTATPTLAGVAVLTRQFEKAARLLGASLTLLENMGARSQPNDQYEIDLYIAELKRLYDEESFQREWAAGAAMSYAQVLAYTLE